MSQLNRAAAEVMAEVGVDAATDVTGFGLMGHLLQMLGSRVGAEIRFSDLPLLEESVVLAERGVLPGGSKRNREDMENLVDIVGLDEARTAILFDAQTSGGLLMAVPEDRLGPLMQGLDKAGVTAAARIGQIVEGEARVKVTQ